MPFLLALGDPLDPIAHRRIRIGKSPYLRMLRLPRANIRDG